MIKFRFTRIGIPLFTCTLAVRLPLLKRQHVRTGRNTLQPRVSNSLILNLNLCRKRKLNPERISLLKRKAQHRKKRIPRKKHDGKVKNTESPVHRAGLLFMPLLEFWFRIIAPGFCASVASVPLSWLIPETKKSPLYTFSFFNLINLNYLIWHKCPDCDFHIFQTKPPTGFTTAVGASLLSSIFYLPNYAKAPASSRLCRINSLSRLYFQIAPTPASPNFLFNAVKRTSNASALCFNVSHCVSYSFLRSRFGWFTRGISLSVWLMRKR